MPKMVDLQEQRFGRLIVLERDLEIRSTVHWNCQCDCGNVKRIDGQALRRGKTTSCGCYHNEQVSIQFSKHKESCFREYNIWRQMKQRCYNPKKDNYKYYGERGIKICDEWKDNFISFLEWTKTSGYQDHLTIDRKDNDGDYSPSNCRWVTMKEQNANKRQSKGRKTPCQ